jgi:hypothetical protein
MTVGQFNRTMTAGDIISSVGIECGLPKISDPFASTDPQYIRLITLLNVAGNQLLDLYPWCRLQNRFELITVPDPDGVQTCQLNYQLPADWNAMLDQTMWKKGGLYPGFPISIQSWQYLANVQAAITIQVIFMERDGIISVAPGTAVGMSLNMMYESRGWVLPQTSSFASNDPYSDNCKNSNDTVLHDPSLTTRYLKMKFLESVGFDTQKATDDFNLVLENRQSKDRSAPILNTGRPGAIGPYRLIDGFNAPQTGFGGSGGVP